MNFWNQTFYILIDNRTGEPIGCNREYDDGPLFRIAKSPRELIIFDEENEERLRLYRRALPEFELGLQEVMVAKVGRL